jgi:hypothetical protein
MQCRRLELQFRRKNATRPAPPKGPVRTGPPHTKNNQPTDELGGGLEIMTVRARGEVNLAAESENMKGFGTELDYDRTTEITTIRGFPATVMRDSSIIVSPQVSFCRQGETTPTTNDELREIGRALGPGHASLIDSKDGRRLDVSWQDLLTVEQEGRLEKITISGRAICEVREQHQRLEGDLVKLWLLEEAVPATPAVVAGKPRPAATLEKNRDPDATEETRKKPHKLLAVGHVAARSAELIVRNTNQLTAWFQDVPELPVSQIAPAAPAAMNTPTGSQIQPAGLVSAEPPKNNNVTNTSAPATANSEPPKIPIELSAENMEAYVLRSGQTSDLDRVYCKERVTVHQDPRDPKDKALDISCRELDLQHTPDGDRLRVRGTLERWARIDSQNMTLLGPKIMFDQKDNRAEMEVGGRMQLPASSSLSGETLEQPSDIVITWRGKMTFNGSWASFHGDVKAEQDGITVTCPKMDVYFDRVVSFRRLQQTSMSPSRPLPAGQSKPVADNDQPQVKKVFCHRGDDMSLQPVVVTEVVRKDGKLVRMQRITAPVVAFYNDESEMKADGPGEVRTLQYGEKMGPDSQPADQKPKEPEQELQLTRILFQGRMEASNKNRKTTFTSQVRVANLPAEQLDLRIDEDHLPASGFTLRCEQMIASFRMESERKVPTLEAKGRAEIQSEEFSGRSDEIHYDEGKNQQIVFIGSSSNLAALTHIQARGQPGRNFTGKIIMYWRKINRVSVTDSAGGTIPQ